MPCKTDGWVPTREETLAQENKFLTAALCALLTNLEVYGQLTNLVIQEKEAGVTAAEIKIWWIRHKEKDVQRRIREENQRLEAKRKQDAYNKLTPEERKLLGVK